MTLTIELPDETAARARAIAEAEGMDLPTFATVLLLDAIDIDSLADSETDRADDTADDTVMDDLSDDPEALAAIAEAVDEANEAAARGDYGKPIDQFWRERDAEFGSIAARPGRERPV